MSEVLKNLALDRWHKVLMAVGAVLMFTAITIEVKALSNVQALLLGGAMFCIGLGTWKCERSAIRFVPPNAYLGGSMHWTERYYEPEFVGTLLQLIGVGLLIWFGVSLYRG